MIAYPFALRAARCRSVCLAIVGLLTCVVSTARADDDDIVNANGFELPFSTTFLGTGQLEGQVNPAGEGQVIPPGQWLRTQGPGASTAVVQSAVFAPGGGTQAVRVNRAANDNSRWAVPVNHLGYPDWPNPFPPEPQQPFICISWNMRVEQSLSALETFGPFFGVEAYDDDVNAVGLLASLGVDASTGDILYQAPGTGFLTEIGTKVNFGEWNQFAIELDYSTDTYKIVHNFFELGTFAFVDSGLNQFSDADIAAFAAAGDVASQALSGTAYFDNFLVREGICFLIPEPATWALAAVGLMGVALRRRRAS